MESLVGVASARVVLTEDGALDAVHVLALPGAEPGAVSQAVLSALRARFDLKADRERVFVARMRGREPPEPSGVPGQTPGGPAEAEEADSRSRSGFRDGSPRSLMGGGPTREAGPPPWPERREGGALPGEGGVRTPSGRHVGEASSDELASRLLFLGHRTAKRRFQDVEVAVDLEWRGRRHRGAASVQDEPSERLLAPALATLRALDATLANVGPVNGAPDRGVGLDLRGVQMVEALGERHVLVSVVAEVGSTSTPLTGTVTVRDSVELATILATLRATDRRIRAILLDRLPGNGGPPGSD